MIIRPNEIHTVTTDLELIAELHALDGQRILELGCGKAELTRGLAEAGTQRQVLALEVDEIQHARNLQIRDLPNVTFELSGAQSIPGADESFDAVFMFKSLHHVPVELMGTALAEIHRVLVPGGLAHFSEPLAQGGFDELLRLFHDERLVRSAAFEAIESAVTNGRFELVGQHFFETPFDIADFAQFERDVIHSTHSDHALSPDVLAQVKALFESHMTPTGVTFMEPYRVDLLRKA